MNGQFGMFSAGTTWLPPQDSLATVASCRDGHVRIGTWGQDLGSESTIIDGSTRRPHCRSSHARAFLLALRAKVYQPQVLATDRSASRVFGRQVLILHLPGVVEGVKGGVPD